MPVKKPVKKKVPDDAYLYRRISKDKCYIGDDGEYKIDPTAFQDPQRQPSVDVAHLLSNDPYKANKLRSTDGIICIQAGDVREIGTVKTNTTGGPVQHSVDVIYDPSKSNKAHALITVNPDFFGTKNAKRNAFKRLRIALASLANKNYPRFILKPK